MTADQLKSTIQGANQYDLGIIGAGILAFIFSLFSYYTYGPFSTSAWHSFFGWFAALVAVASAAPLAARLFGVNLLEASLMRLVCLGGFAVASLCVILALFVDPAGIDEIGRGFGYWASLVVILAGTALAFMRKDATD